MSRLRGALLAVISSVGLGVAQDMPVPPELQAAIFKKIFTYDRTLQAKPRWAVLVVFNASSAPLKAQIVKAFYEAGVQTSEARADQAESAISDAAVVYLAPGVDQLKDLCRKHGVLSITGVPSIVERGGASVGLGLADGKPRIIVHLQQLKAEGHDLSANLLQLAKVIQ
jgi:hypothetical protein